MDSDSCFQYPIDAENWWIDRMYLQDAVSVARHSEDPSTQVGAILVLPNAGPVLSAWNHVLPVLSERGYPRQVSDKGFCTEHAERAVIFKALKNGLSVGGLTMYCTWAACAECARSIIHFGIRRVVTFNSLVERTPDRWNNSVRAGQEMMMDSGIQLVGWRGDLGTKYSIRFNGQIVENEDFK